MQIINNINITDNVCKQEQQNGENIDFFSNINEIEKIAEQAGGLNDLFFEFAAPYVELLCNEFQISQTGAALFAILVSLYKGDDIRLENLTSHLKLKFIKMLPYKKELEILEQKRLIQIIRKKLFV